MKKHCRIVALAGILVLAGCTTGKTTSGESLGQTVNRHEQQIQSILSQVGQVEQVLPGQAEMWSQMQSMRQELNQINGQLSQTGLAGGGADLGVMQENITRLQAATRKIASQLAIDVGPLEAGGSFDATDPMVSSGMQTPPPTVPIQTTTTAIPADKNTAQTLYDGGIKAFDQRRYKDAVAAFKSFTSNYPKHQLAGNAAFWEGESYYQLGEYGRAALAYQEVLDKYKTSPKYQASLLKQGIAFHNAGKKSAAKERLQELVSRYPSSSEASRAKQFMTTNKL